MNNKNLARTLFSKLSQLPTNSSIAFISGIFFAVVLGVGAVVLSTSSLAGSLTPPGSPANTFYTLTDLYNLASGTTTSEGVGDLPATPGTATGTMYTLTQVYNALATQISNVSSTTLKAGTTAFGQTGTVYPAGLLKTGQTTCHSAGGSTISCSGTGQDGELQKGQARSYTDNGNGTVTDNMTGLTWQQANATNATWVDALTYCNNNTPSLPGSGWRLPNVNELFSLIDFGISSFAKINSAYFDAMSVAYWSATTHPLIGYQKFALSVDFSTSFVASTDKAYSNRYIRCVRG